jgi:MFS superfamily sulfate permease-like transporter
VPSGIPAPRLPDFALFADLLPDAIAIAIVTFALTISLAKLFAKRAGYRIDDSQEPYAYGKLNCKNNNIKTLKFNFILNLLIQQK